MKSKGNNPENKGNQTTKVFELLVPILLLPTIVLTGYLVAFLHEIGYTSRFGIPIDLIRIDATAMITSLPPVLLLAFLLLLSVIMLAVVTWVNNKLPEQKKHFMGFLLFLAWMNVILTTPFIYSSIRGYLGKQSAYISAGLLIFEFVIFVISISIYQKRIDKDLDMKLNQDVSKYWESVKKPSALFIFISCGIIALCLLAWVGGTTDALSTKSYLEPSTPAKSVVLRIYGDNVICAPINDSNQIERSFFVLKLDDPTITLTFHQYDSPFVVVPVTIEKH